jgi:hypothetical protein
VVVPGAVAQRPYFSGRWQEAFSRNDSLELDRGAPGEVTHPPRRQGSTTKRRIDRSAALFQRLRDGATCPCR